MQIKILFITTGIALGLFADSAIAQQYQQFEMSPPKGKIISNDTLVKESRPIASKLPREATMLTPAVSLTKLVPLAGEAAYYGKMTDYVNDFVRKYFDSHDRTLSAVKARGKKIFPTIDNVLKKNKIPKELKYLAVIESALVNTATSGVGARGPWQFMDFTARDMGLVVNGKRDDRTDWHKSTVAATKYLNALYAQLDDWLLVVAAYNCGPVPIKRAIKKAGSNSFWDIKKMLPRETQGHVLAFIATATIFEQMNGDIGKGGMPEDFEFANEKKVGVKKVIAPKKPAFTQAELENMAVVRINEPIAIDILVNSIGMDRKQLTAWNADYSLFEYNNYEETFYGLRIPKDKLEAFIQKKSELIKDSRYYYSELAP